MLERLSRYPVSWGYDLAVHSWEDVVQLRSNVSDSLLELKREFGNQESLALRYANTESMILAGHLTPGSRKYRKWNFIGNTSLFALSSSPVLSEDSLAAYACVNGNYKHRTTGRKVCQNPHACPACSSRELGHYTPTFLSFMKEQGLYASHITLASLPLVGEHADIIHLLWKGEMAALRDFEEDLGIVGGVFRYEVALAGLPRLERIATSDEGIENIETFAYRVHLHAVVLSETRLGRDAEDFLTKCLSRKFESALHRLNGAVQQVKSLRCKSGVVVQVKVPSLICDVNVKPLNSDAHIRNTLAYLKKPMGVVKADSVYSQVASAIEAKYPDDPLRRRWAYVQLHRACVNVAEFFRISTAQELTTKKKVNKEEVFKPKPSFGLGKRISRSYGAFGIISGNGGRRKGDSVLEAGVLVSHGLPTGSRSINPPGPVQPLKSRTSPRRSERKRIVAPPPPRLVRLGPCAPIPTSCTKKAERVYPAPDFMEKIRGRLSAFSRRKADSDHGTEAHSQPSEPSVDSPMSRARVHPENTPTTSP